MEWGGVGGGVLLAAESWDPWRSLWWGRMLAGGCCRWTARCDVASVLECPRVRATLRTYVRPSCGRRFRARSVTFDCKSLFPRSIHTCPLVAIAVVTHVLVATGHYTAVKDFIEGSASGFPNLEVEYVRGQSPQLMLSTDSLNVEPEVLGIGTWKQEHIEEFLKSKLRA
jgi:hypothetical protein